jgi:hypothetical protein
VAAFPRQGDLDIILVTEQFLDFPQILSHVVEQNCRRGMPQPVRGDLPHPEESGRFRGLQATTAFNGGGRPDSLSIGLAPGSSLTNDPPESPALQMDRLGQ